MLTGDINLMNVTDPQVPFARVKDTLRQADVLFGNLECCFYEPAAGHPVEREGFYAPAATRWNAKVFMPLSPPPRPSSSAGITRSATPTT